MKKEKTRLVFGLWKSPFTPASLSTSLSFSDVGWDESGNLLWLESRMGRNVLVVQPPDGQAARDLNSEYTIRARVGYGGGDFGVGQGLAFFIDGETGSIVRQPLDQGQAARLTPAFGSAAAPVLSPDKKWLLYVHSYQDGDSLAVVDVQGKFWPQRLALGQDFFMQPVWRPSAAGDPLWIACVQWSHPNMPWDGTQLCIGRLEPVSGNLPVLVESKIIAGDEHTSIFQPVFSSDGRYLAYVSDATGWWQIYLYDLQNGNSVQLTTSEAEHAVPAWTQGKRTIQFSPDGKRIFCLRNQGGRVTLWQIELESGRESQIQLDISYSSLDQIAMRPGNNNPVEIALLVADDRIPHRVITCRPDAGVTRVWRRATPEHLTLDNFSVSEAVCWHGMDGGEVHGQYNPPQNPGYNGIGLPPLMVMIHGGPTSQRRATYSPENQFFTSRGYAVLEVNYRGSTGYGRSYTQALRGQWGVLDVQDTVSGAKAMVERGLVDPGKLVIMGGSSGGFTVLKALEDYPGFFKAGVCMYGISNLFALAAETHKFEAHYTDSLIGPLPEAAERYRQRSPIFFADQIQEPLAVFQGEIDPVVPRRQSDEIVASLQRRGVPHVYHVFSGEGHGFRNPENIQKFYEVLAEFLKHYVILA